VIIIEHIMDIVKLADYIIDLGPEGGDEGGYVVATGTPEEIANTSQSYTGQYLAPILKDAKVNDQMEYIDRRKQMPAHHLPSNPLPAKRTLKKAKAVQSKKSSAL